MVRFVFATLYIQRCRLTIPDAAPPVKRVSKTSRIKFGIMHNVAPPEGEATLNEDRQ